MSDDEPTTKFDPDVDFAFTTLDRGTRKELVDLTATTAANAALIHVNDLELSALGANADLFGNWTPSKSSNLASWTDVGHGGRAVRSVSVRRGYLFPLGHQAIIVRTFVRSIGVDPKNAASDPHNYPVAYLQERTFVHVTEPVKSYPAVGQPFAAAHGTTDWPFASVRMTTLTSPAIDSTKIKYLVKGSTQAQWMTAGGDYIAWSFVATDLAGHDVSFSIPLVFVYGYDKNPASKAKKYKFSSEYSSWTDQLAAAYEKDTAHTHSTTGGAKMRFAPEVTGKDAAGQTTHPTLLIVLGAATTAYNENTSPSNFAARASEKHLDDSGQPNFYPTIKSARVRLHAAETLKGESFHDTRPKNDPLPDVGGVELGYYGDYVRYGSQTYGKSSRDARASSKTPKPPSNAGAVYAETRNHTALNLPASTVGGLGTPNVAITGLSAKVGTIGGTLSHYAEHSAADLASYFPTALSSASAAIAQLLGGLNLGDILDKDGFAMPTISSQTDATTGIPTVTYALTTPLTAGWPSSEPIFVPDTGSTDDATPSFTMTAVFTSPTSGPPTYTVSGSIDPFTLYLVGQGGTFDFISLHFESLTFTSGSGASPVVTVNLDTVKFDGVLEFVNLLEEFLSELGGSGLSVDVQPTQVVVGTSLSLPDLSVGIFSLSGIAFNAGLTIPFINGPAVATFSFASAANPFTLTVSMFGGGGFVALGLGYGSVHSVQAQFEFVGQFAFDIAVANGSLSLVAGVYFSYTTPDTAAHTGGIALTGFVRVTGQLQVLGIITISAELDLSLTYASATGAVVGSATLLASVSICGLSKTVGITMTKQFAGSSAPPTAHIARTGHARAVAAADESPVITWTDLMAQTDWNTYCAAFTVEKLSPMPETPDITVVRPTIKQTVIWTALPQGRGADTGTLRLSVFVTPQLTYLAGTKAHPVTSTTLPTFKDWADWPSTIENAALGVSFNGASPVTATWDPKLLRSTFWTAMFVAAKTRVDSFTAEDFSAVPIKTFGASAIHRFVTGVYGEFNVATPSGASLTLSPNKAHPTKPLVASGKAAPTYARLIAPPSAIAKALEFHAAALPKHGEPPVQPAPPILDFHSAVASLGAYPELLRLFGLAIPLQVTIPAHLASATSFTVAVVPTYSSALSDTINVSLPTAATLSSSQFLPTPYGVDYLDGMLDLGSGVLANSRFSIVDVDVDGASQGINATNQSIASIVEANTVAESVTLDYGLPSLRSSGPSLLWDDWGGSGKATAGDTQNLSSLSIRQAKITSGVAAWIADRHKALPTIHAEDINRGWRVDVLNNDDSTPAWKSLHWRLAGYSFGTGGTFTVSPDESVPYEGFVIPGVTHEPVPQGTLPSSISVHESIARWDGWSLSAPRPGGQINDDGTSSPAAAGNPMPSATVTDSDGNINPQISAEFVVAPGGADVNDPVTGAPVGKTGLPALRFGATYQYRARSVDLSGWSIPQNTTTDNSRVSLPTAHYRWEPIQAPYVVPTAPMTAGEGALTIVLRDDGVHAATASSRWLFPPKVHEQFAEEHGAFDSGGLPNPAAYTTITDYNDGSLMTVSGVTTGNTNNVVLPVASNPAPTITWLPDPAAAGIAVGGLSRDFPTAPIIPAQTDIINSNASPAYLDLWEPTSGAAWPALQGKLLTIVPGTATAGATVPLTPGWSVTAATDQSAEVLTVTVTPGSVYQLTLSSLLLDSTLPSFGQWYWISQNLIENGNPHFLPAVLAPALEGQAYQLTPNHIIRVVYAVLLPTIAPSFSVPNGDEGPRLTRSSNATTVTIEDIAFAVDLPTTSSVTFTATWTDPVDDTKNAHPDTETVNVTQGSLVAAVSTFYPPPVAPDPIVPTLPAAASPFGSIEQQQDVLSTETFGWLEATHRIGDTKHHLVTYTPVATSRFGQFFATTVSETFTAGSPITLDARGVDANLTTVVLPANGSAKSVTVPASRYVVDASTGQINLVGAAPTVTQGDKLVSLLGTPLDVTYVPTDTVTGSPTPFHVASSATPPPLKIAKVVPAWRITEQSTNAGQFYTRSGNILRVYLERPWYATGANELLGVVAGTPYDTAVTPKQSPNVGLNQISAIGFDPISAPGQRSSSPFTQDQLSFVVSADVPAWGDVAGGNPVTAIPTPYDPGGDSTALWAYQPSYDSVSDMWYADIELDVTKFPTPLPAGYFMQLALVRFQPYSISSYVSPVSLVTFAQPVTDRTVSVAQLPGDTTGQVVGVTVTGPSYVGWRPLTTENPATKIYDRDNRYALHPNSDGKGTETTSTMVVEVQVYDDSGGFSGDFGWSTYPGAVHRLTPSFTNAPVIEWTGPTGGITIPTGAGQTRLRISELDYYPYAADGLPATIGTGQRRSFVAYI